MTTRSRPTKIPSERRNGPFSQLPHVLIQLIFHYPPLKELLFLSRTSRLFYQLADTDIAWKAYPRTTLGAADLSSTHPSDSKFIRRIIVLDSSHTHYAQLHTSLILRHCAIHWDVCHDTLETQLANSKLHKRPFRTKNQLIFDSKLEAKVLSQHIRYLNLLVISDGFCEKELELLFTQQAHQPTLHTLTLTVNNIGSWRDGLPHVTDQLSRLMTTIVSLTNLTIHSLYHSSGQLALLSQLPLLSTLVLIEDPWIPNGLFEPDDLLTLGSLPSLTSLSILKDQGFCHRFTMTDLTTFLQQPNLANKLQSLTIDSIVEVDKQDSPFSMKLLFDVFDGYHHLTELVLKFPKLDQPGLFQSYLLLALSNQASLVHTDTRPTDDHVITNPFYSSSAPGTFLPSLRHLVFSNSPGPQLEFLLKNNSRPQLSIRILKHPSQGLDLHLERFRRHYPRQFQVQSQSYHPSRLAHLRRRPESWTTHEPVPRYDWWMGQIDQGEAIITGCLTDTTKKK